MNNTRINELTSQITAFNKGKYGKNELLHEYLNFEKQVGVLAFNEEHAENAKLRMSDVVSYLHKKLDKGYMDLDYNIGEKVNNKEVLLRYALEKFQTVRKKELNIVKLVVFANSKINVDNRYKYVEKCYLSQLPHIIDDYAGEDIYTLEELSYMERCIKNAETKELYAPVLDFDQFKLDIATALSMIEENSNTEIRPKKDVTIPYFLTKEWAKKEKEKWHRVEFAAGLAGAFVAGAVTHKLCSKR